MPARVTDDTLVGQAKTDIIATKDLLVRPVLPRFFVAGDKAEIAAVIHNTTARTRWRWPSTIAGDRPRPARAAQQQGHRGRQRHLQGRLAGNGAGRTRTRSRCR